MFRITLRAHTPIAADDRKPGHSKPNLAKILQVGLALCVVLFVGGCPRPTATLTEFQPNIARGGRSVVLSPPPTPTATLTEFQPNIARGGRSVAISIYSGNTQVAIAASESGGLFQTTDGGQTWSHIDSLPAFRMSDVSFVPRLFHDPQIVIATATHDANSDPQANHGGIWASSDAGATWTHIVLPSPCSTAAVSGNGIAYGPLDDVYVATDCGLLVNRSLGWGNWTQTNSWTIWNSVGIASVVAQVSTSATNAGALIIDVCRQGGGHQRWISGPSAAWSPLHWGPACQSSHSIATSPLDSNVLFATSFSNWCWNGQTLLESDDGGLTWPIDLQACSYSGRPPFVATHPATDQNRWHFDLYYSGRQTTCSYTATAQRCSFNRPLAPAGSGMSSLGDSYGEHVYFVAGDEHVHQLSYKTPTWVDTDLTQSTNGPSAPPGSRTSSFGDGYGEHAYYVANDQHVHQLWYNNQVWVDTDLTSSTSGPSAPPGSAISSEMGMLSLVNDLEDVYYVANDQHVHKLWYNAQKWTDTDLTQFTSPPPPSVPPGSEISSFTGGYGKHLYFVASDQHAYQISDFTISWASLNLTQSVDSWAFIPNVPNTNLNHDINGVAFDPWYSNCAVYEVEDFGVLKMGSPSAGKPCGDLASWTLASKASAGYGALQIYDITGLIIWPETGDIKTSSRTDLFIGTMDNMEYAVAGVGDSAVWQAFGAEGSFLQVLNNSSQSAQAEDYRLNFVDFGSGGFAAETIIPNLANGTWANPEPWTATNYPPGNGSPSFLVAPHTYVEWEPPGTFLFLTEDSGQSWWPVGGLWPLGPGPSNPLTPLNRIQVANTMPGLSPVVYDVVADSNGNSGIAMLANFVHGPWVGIPIPGFEIRTLGGKNQGGSPSGLKGVWGNCFGDGAWYCAPVFSADPNNYRHLYAMDSIQQFVVVSHDTGETWNEDIGLTNLISASGVSMEDSIGNSQVHVFAFDPANSSHILVGTDQAGIFASANGGLTWSALPNTARATAITSFFFDDRTNTVYVGTYGRGLWKLTLDWTTVQ